MTPEIIGYIAATLTTSSFLPQAIMTLRTRDTESLSLGMYATFTLGILLWLIYGIYLDDNAIIYANAITLVLASSILFIKVYNTFSQKRIRPPAVIKQRVIKSTAYDFVIQERIRPPAAINQRVTKSMTYNFVIQEDQCNRPGSGQ